MQFKIPKRFKILGQTIDVHTVSHIAKTNGTLGEARFSANEITLQDSVEGYKLPDSMRGQVFLHEVMHMVFLAIGEEELASDEKIVDLTASVLYQILTTMEYEDKKPTKKEKAVVVDKVVNAIKGGKK